MKKIQILALVVFIVMTLNLLIPCFSLAIEQTELEENNTRNNNEQELISKQNIIEDKESNKQDNETDSINNNVDYKINNYTNEEQNNQEIIEENNENDFSIEEKMQNDMQIVKVEEQEIGETIEETEIVKDEEFSIFIMNGTNKINLYEKNDINYLFVPKTINLSKMVINYTGNIESIGGAELNKDTKQITGLFQNESSFTITLTNGQTENVIILQSDLPSIFVKLEDDITLETVNNGSKEIKYGALVDIQKSENDVNNINQVRAEFKGRGNYTWSLPKKPYQIKFEKKQSILGMNKAKTWILLANYLDNSYMRNKTAFDFAKKLGLNYTPDYEFVDLWVNGDYIGNYMVVEKIQVNENRVNLTDMNGIISELDNQYYYEENNWFESNISKTKFTLKDSYADDENEDNSVSKQAFSQFESDINRFENLLYTKNKEWDKISSIIDVDSFIKYYFVQELSENSDGCRSSVFMYKDGNDDKIHMGPVWDFDIAFGNFTSQDRGGNPKIDYIININKYMDNSNNWYAELFKIKEFREEVLNLYNTNIKFILEKVYNNLDISMPKSAYMNNIIWDTLGKKSKSDRINEDSYQGECQYIKEWIQQRIEYLNERYGVESNIYKIKYQSHIQDIGWENNTLENGEMSGTEGQAKRIEAMQIYLDTFNKQLSEKVNIKYQGHIQDIGWQNWKNEGEILGTEGQSKRVEAIKIRLDGTNKFSIRYRVHIQDIGWQDWKYDGDIAGTTGESKRIEAIEMELVEKEIDYINEDTLINYKAHVQNIGDTEYGSDGEVVGTTGRGIRLEGLNIKLNEALLSNVSLIIDTHIQDIGWQTGFTDKQFIGTRGKSLRMEAIKIRLAGDNAENYSIKYRVHVQDIGWQNWKENGEIAGTEGQSKRIEAIQIQIVEK